MQLSVHQSPRLASIILFLSFFMGWALFSFMPSSWKIDNTLPRFWLLISLLPLIIIAYWQNPHRLRGQLNPTNYKRIVAKSKILMLQIIAIVISSIAIEFISGSDSYGSFSDDVYFILPILLILTPFYVWFVDKRIANPYDEYAQIGEMLNKQIPVDRFIIKKFLLKTAVKIIFVPFMYSGFLLNLNHLLNLNYTTSSISVILFNIGISLDMLVGIFGYLISSSLIDNQVKDTDNHLLGWIFALLCYPPLQYLRTNLSAQTDNLIWSDIIPEGTILYAIFFVIINALWIIYWLATFEFGMTFSNLSWRKLVDKGVYRYTKHPAYLSKNIYWWLHTLPFCGVVWFSANWWENVLTLTLTSFIYYARACSEERHLMKFPEYQAYAEYISQHGIFRKIRVPFIK